MIRNTGTMTKPAISFLNALQDALITIMDFAEMSQGPSSTQLQTAMERIRYGYRAVNSFKTTIEHVTLKLGEIYTLPACGLYGICILKETFERLTLNQIMSPITTQGLKILLKDKLICIQSLDGNAQLILFLEFELEVFP